MGKKEAEYLKRMRALGYEPSLAGMDEGDFDYELARMGQSRQDDQPPAPQLNRAYRPVDPGLAARIFRQMGQPYDPQAIGSKESFYIGGRDNGDDDEAKPFVPQGRGRRPDEPYNPRDGVWRLDWGGNDTGASVQPMSNGSGKGDGLNWSVDPLGMFPQYESAQSATGSLTGKGTLDRYRNSEIVPGVAEEANTKQDGNTKTDSEDSLFGEKVLTIGRKQLGLPYEINGDGVSSTDCGKFTLDTFNKTGINLGTRMADEQHEFCKTNGSVFKDMSQARPGDLVFFQNTYGSWDPGTITHVGIYAGDGKMLHAGSSNGVSHADLNNDYWQSHFAEFGRPRR